MMDVNAFLKAQDVRMTWNCSTEPADWCVTLGYPDFAAKWRDITDPHACDSTVADAGDLLTLWREGIGNALPVVTSYQAGDISVIEAHGLQAGAVYTGERWAIRSKRGHLFASPDMVRVAQAWRP